MKLFLSLCALALGSLLSAGAPQAETSLRPLMCVPDKVVLHDDFSKAGEPNKAQWGPRQGTRWTIADGVLRGQPSTPEYQASRQDHKGLEPRIAATATPPQFIAEFRFRYMGGKEAVGPFIEFGHHVCRLHMSSQGAELLAGQDAIRVAEAKDFHFTAGQWYHVLAEMQGDEFVIQFAGGPTVYAKNEIFAKPAASGAAGVGFGGYAGGTAEIDDVTLSSVKPGTQPSWAAKRDSFPKFTPAEAAKTSKKKKAAE